MGKDIGNRVIQKFQSFIISLTHQVSGFREVRQMILGQILQLDVSAGKPSGSVSSLELEHASRPSVLAGCHLHRLVFPN